LRQEQDLHKQLLDLHQKGWLMCKLSAEQRERQ